MLIDWPPARLRLEKSYIRGDADHAENSTGSHFPDLPPAFQIDQVSKEMYMKTSCKVIIINWLNWVNVDWFIFTVWPHRVLRLYILLREMIYYLYIVRRLWLPVTRRPGHSHDASLNHGILYNSMGSMSELTSVGPAYIIGEGKIAITVLAGSRTFSSNNAWCCFILHGNVTSSSLVQPPDHSTAPYHIISPLINTTLWTYAYRKAIVLQESNNYWVGWVEQSNFAS